MAEFVVGPIMERMIDACVEYLMDHLKKRIDKSSSEINTATPGSSEATPGSSETTPGSSESTMPDSLKFVMNNIEHIVTTKLAEDNYPMWRSQVLKLVRANELEGFLDGSTPCPPKQIFSNVGQPLRNPAYRAWRMIDQNLALALFSRITSSIQPYVSNLDSAHELWTTIEQRLQATNRLRIIQLKNELHSVSMKTQTLSEYLTQIKSIVDNLAAADASIDTEDIILYTLNGLPPQFQTFKTLIRNQLTLLSLDDFYSLLLSEEINLAKETKDLTSYTPIKETLPIALHAQRRRGKNRYSHAGGRWNPYFNQSGGNSAQPARTSTNNFQICNKSGHSASQGCHRLNVNYKPQQSATPTVMHTSQMQTTLVSWHNMIPGEAQAQMQAQSDEISRLRRQLEKQKDVIDTDLEEGGNASNDTESN